MLIKAYNQQATYWGSPKPDGNGGYTFSAPKTLQVRWEQKQEEYSNEVGDTLVSQAVVFVLEDLDIGGYLLLGTSSATNPTAVEGAFEIKQFVKIPDLRGARYERRAYL